MPTTAALEGIVADLRTRLALLRARKDAHTMGQRDNIMGLDDDLAEAEKRLLARKAVRPGDMAWYVPPRVGSVALGLATNVTGDLPWIGVRRRGQAVRWLGTPNGKKPTVRARVADDYEILVDGVRVTDRLLTRREACREAHRGAAGLPHGGELPEALRMRGRALARFLHENREGRTNRRGRKAEKRRRAKVRSLLAFAEVQDALARAL